MGSGQAYSGSGISDSKIAQLFLKKCSSEKMKNYPGRPVKVKDS